MDATEGSLPDCTLCHSHTLAGGPLLQEPIRPRSTSRIYNGKGIERFPDLLMLRQLRVTHRQRGQNEVDFRITLGTMAKLEISPDLTRQLHRLVMFIDKVLRLAGRSQEFVVLRTSNSRPSARADISQVWLFLHHAEHFAPVELCALRGITAKTATTFLQVAEEGIVAIRAFPHQGRCFPGIKKALEDGHLLTNERHEGKYIIFRVPHHIVRERPPRPEVPVLRESFVSASLLLLRKPLNAILLKELGTSGHISSPVVLQATNEHVCELAIELRLHDHIKLVEECVFILAEVVHCFQNLRVRQQFS
mmetsp:Transcript_91432/g.200368  ORF Transcript_91432/g.200368 Transcript_91432/m.200368 type:complete len:306 (+) Transcript_91432:87-1004(+)